MLNNALYVYGIVKFGFDLNWKETGLNKEQVSIIREGKFSALVHNCQEKPYLSKDPNRIKELIIVHNKVLNKAMKDFFGVIPLPFNTIIKNRENSAEDNLKKWLKDDKKRLEKVWDKIKNKKEYGIRIYYQKEKLIQEAKQNQKIKEIETSIGKKTQGISYLLQGKVKSEINDIVYNKIQKFKQEFNDNIKKIANNIVVNVSKIAIDEDSDLLLSLSILVKEKQIGEIKNFLENKEKEGFNFNMAGPFAPYSFVENGK